MNPLPSISDTLIKAAQNRVQAAQTGVTSQAPFSTEAMMNALNRIPSINATQASGLEHALIYGPPGSGKTVAAALLSEFFNILWFDGDKGTSAIRNNLPEEMQTRIKIINIPDTSDFPLFFNTMYQILTGRKLNLCVEHGVKDCPVCSKNEEAIRIDIALNVLPRNWIVVMDSMTQYVASAINHSIRKSNKLALTSGAPTPMDYKMEFDDWGLLKNIMESTGSFIKDLRCNFVSISHEADVKLEDKSSKLVPVGGSDNSSKNFAKHFDSVVFCRTMNGKHAYASSSVYSSQIQTKTRSNVALEKTTTPALLHIFRPNEAEGLLKGSYNEWFYSGQNRANKYTIHATLE